MERFWQQVNKQGPMHPVLKTRCWLWTGAVNADGYGRYQHSLAHRYAFRLRYGRWPTPCGLHKCDNPPCVRFAHLVEGTQLANVKDRDSKGRVRHGVRHADAKLTLSQVKELRRLHTEGWSSRQLAAWFKISQHNAWGITANKTWKRV